MLIRTETFRFAQAEEAGVTAPNAAAAAIETATSAAAGTFNIAPTVHADCELLVVIAGGTRDADDLTSITLSSDVDGALTAIVSPADPGAARTCAGVWYFQNPTAGAHTVTATKNGGGNMESFWMVAMQLKDVDAATPFETDFDYAATDVTASATPLVLSGSVTTVQDNSLLIAFATVEDPTNVATLAVDSGLTLVHDGTTNAVGSDADTRYVVGTRVITPAGAAAWEIDASGTEDWAAGAVAVRGLAA